MPVYSWVMIQINDVSFDSSGTYLAAAGAELNVIHVKPFSVISSFHEATASVTGVRFGENALSIFCVGMDKSLRIYKAQNWQKCHWLTPNWRSCFSPSCCISFCSFSRRFQNLVSQFANVVEAAPLLEPVVQAQAWCSGKTWFSGLVSDKNNFILREVGFRACDKIKELVFSWLIFSFINNHRDFMICAVDYALFICQLRNITFFNDFFICLESGSL